MREGEPGFGSKLSHNGFRVLGFSGARICVGRGNILVALGGISRGWLGNLLGVILDSGGKVS
jgi:hypothetical protein